MEDEPKGLQRLTDKRLASALSRLDAELAEIEQASSALVEAEFRTARKGEISTIALATANKILEVWGGILNHSLEKDHLQDVAEGDSWDSIGTAFEELEELRREHPDEVNIAVTRPLNSLAVSRFQERAAISEAVEKFTETVLTYRNRNFTHGERVPELEGSKVTVKPHPQGMLVKKGKSVLLNGWEVIYNGKCDDFFAHPQGAVIRVGKRFLLNGDPQAELYNGPFDQAWEVDDGIMIRHKDALYLDGRFHERYNNEGLRTHYHPHPKGTIREGTRINFGIGDYFLGRIRGFSLNNQLLINEYSAVYTSNNEVKVGIHLLGFGSSAERKAYPYKAGVAFENTATIAVPQPSGRSVNEKRKVLWRCDDLDNPTKVVYIHHGHFNEVKPHPEGLLVKEGDKIFFDDREIYDAGPFDEWAVHQQGALVRKGKEWRMYPIHATA